MVTGAIRLPWDGLLLGVLSAALSAITKWPWPIVSTAVSALAAGMIFHINFVRPRLRRRKLKNPVKAWFLIPAQHRHPLNYAISDTDDHAVSELILPPHSECEIQICMSPLVSFRNSELSFGFDWMGETDLKKPIPIEFFSPFVERGALRRGNPDSDPTHYMDFSNHYHIRRDILYVVGQDVAFGFKIMTRDAGVYRTHLTFKAEEVEGTAFLSLRVEDFPPKTRMKCTCHGHFIGVPQLR
jgi:hypothetical protein